MCHELIRPKTQEEYHDCEGIFLVYRDMGIARAILTKPLSKPYNPYISPVCNLGEYESKCVSSSPLKDHSDDACYRHRSNDRSNNGIERDGDPRYLFKYQHHDREDPDHRTECDTRTLLYHPRKHSHVMYDPSMDILVAEDDRSSRPK